MPRRANSSRTNFVLFDARSYKESAINKGLKELACVNYVCSITIFYRVLIILQTKTILPRELSVAIAALHIPDDQVSQNIFLKVTLLTKSARAIYHGYSYRRQVKQSKRYFVLEKQSSKMECSYKQPLLEFWWPCDPAFHQEFPTNPGWHR